jgi:hypothetical protein
MTSTYWLPLESGWSRQNGRALARSYGPAMIVHLRWKSGPELLSGERLKRRVNRRPPWNLVASLFPSRAAQGKAAAAALKTARYRRSHNSAIVAREHPAAPKPAGKAADSRRNRLN